MRKIFLYIYSFFSCRKTRTVATGKIDSQRVVSFTKNLIIYTLNNYDRITV